MDDARDALAQLVEDSIKLTKVEERLRHSLTMLLEASKTIALAVDADPDLAAELGEALDDCQAASRAIGRAHDLTVASYESALARGRTLAEAMT